MDAQNAQTQRTAENAQRFLASRLTRPALPYTQTSSHIFVMLNIYSELAGDTDDDRKRPFFDFSGSRSVQTPRAPEMLGTSKPKTNLADSRATPATATEPEDMTANASRLLMNEIPAQQTPARPIFSPSPPENVVSAPENPLGPQLFEIVRCATGLVVHATEEQLARPPNLQRAVVRARLLAGFNQYLHRAVGEFANRFR